MINSVKDGTTGRQAPRTRGTRSDIRTPPPDEQQSPQASEDNGARPFSRLVNAKVPGWRVLRVDFASHEARCLLETRMAAYLAWLEFDPDRWIIRIRIQLPGVRINLLTASASFQRALACTAAAHVVPDREAEAALVLTGCPFFETSPANATMAFLVCELKQLLEDPDLYAVLSRRERGTMKRQGGGA